MPVASETATPQPETPAPAASGEGRGLPAPKAEPSAVGDAEALDLAGVATFLNVSITTIKQMRADGRLIAPNLAFGRILRWHKAELRIWCLCSCPGKALWARFREQRLKQYLGLGAGLRSA